MKKILSVFVCLCMVITVFAGCTKSKDDTTTTNPVDLKITCDSIYNDYDDSIKSAYESICTAIFNGEESVRVNTGFMDKINQLLNTSFPLFELVKSVDVNADESGVDIEYINDTQTHRQKVLDFANKIKSIQNECKMDSVSQNEYIINLYSYISKNIKVADDETTKCYQTVMYDTGTSYSYASEFEYLLLQSGIKAYHIIAEDAASQGWGLSAAEIDGKTYYFDMMTEFYANGGKSLSYFGMSTNDAINEGLKGFKFTDKSTPEDLTDTRFSYCRICDTWSIKDDNLNILALNGKQYKIKL